MHLSLFKSSRLFLYLGFSLIFLALIVLPARMWVVTQPETPEVELMWLGPIYAVLIGAWSLPNLLLGIVESFKSKKVVLLSLSLILCLANIFLASIIWFQSRYWHGMELRFLLTHSPFIAPCLLANVIGILYFVKDGKFIEAIKNPKVRIFMIITVAVFPLIVAGWVLYMWSMVL